MKKIILIFFTLIFFFAQNLFSQNVKNNVKNTNSFSNLSQNEKDKRLWELCAKRTPDAHDQAEFKLLIKAGANVNYIPEDENWNLLFETVSYQNGFFIDSLCKAGCDVNYIYRTYETDSDTDEKVIDDEYCLIYYALDRKVDFSLIKELIDYGCPLTFVDKKNKKNILAIAFYEEYKKEDILYLMKKGAPVNVEYPSSQKIFPGRLPVIYAVETGDIELVKEFLKYGAKLDVYSEYSCGCALNAAVYSGNMKMVNFCLENGCSLKNIPDEMWTPLDYAIGHENKEMAEFFIKKGVDINHINTSQDETSLISSLTWADIGISDDYRRADLSNCYFALEMGTNPLSTDSYGNTVIKHAIRKASYNNDDIPNCLTYLSFANECIKIAKSKGYKPDYLEAIISNNVEDLKKDITSLKKDAADYDPFYYEALTLKNDCVQYLFDQGFKPTKKAILQNLQFCNLEALELYYKNNVDFNSFDNSNEYSLFKDLAYYHISDKRAECISFILTHGYDINKTVSNYYEEQVTNLGYFADYSHSMVKILIENGADVNLPFGPKKSTPLIQAHDKDNAIELLKAGANMFYEDADGKNFFDYHSNSLDYELKNYITEILSKNYYITTENLNIRMGSSLYEDIIESIKKGTKVKITEIDRYTIIDDIKGFWVRVDYSLGDNTKSGWCFSGYLKELK